MPSAAQELSETADSSASAIVTHSVTNNAPVLQNLEGAFQLFIQASHELEQQQALLQQEIGQLTDDLSQANNRLSALLAALPSGVILIEDGQVRDFNPAAAALIPELTPRTPWVIPTTWSTTAGSNEYLTSSDSTSRTVQLREVLAGNQRVIQLQDITDSLRSHSEGERQAKLASMGKMAASIAHQFRTPLSTATLYAAHLCRPDLDETKRPELAERLRKQLISLEHLSKQMLQFVQQRPRKTEVVLVTQILEDAFEAIQPLCAEHGVSLQINTEATQSMVTVEMQSVVAALVAVLENALQISPVGKSIMVGLNLSPDERRVEICIEDQGPGIHPDMMETLFEPFSTSRINGTGLGLSIARNAIEAHRGEIIASNRPEGGARMLISLPCWSAF